MTYLILIKRVNFFKKLKKIISRCSKEKTSIQPFYLSHSLHTNLPTTMNQQLVQTSLPILPQKRVDIWLNLDNLSSQLGDSCQLLEHVSFEMDSNGTLCVAISLRMIGSLGCDSLFVHEGDINIILESITKDTIHDAWRHLLSFVEEGVTSYSDALNNI